jgi:FKBP-type peptidyl-prolyl cis-trans isomerase FklB
MAGEPTPPPAPPPSNPNPASTQPTQVDDRLAYGVGFTFGQRIRQHLHDDDKTADTGTILKGVIDGLSGHDPAYPPGELAAAVARVEAEERQRQAAQRYATDPSFRKLADDNLARSKALLDQNSAMSGVEVLPDGVQIQELKPGDGRVLEGAKFVTANFEVDLCDGTLVRASEPGKPMRVSTSEALPALLDATRGMRVGAKWRVILPPEKAFGLAGKPPIIGPNQALRYEIELLNAE